jgi:hypothetical protein
MTEPRWFEPELYLHDFEAWCAAWHEAHPEPDDG